MGIGLTITLVLMWLKLRFQWWPDPVAFPIAVAIEMLISTIFATWLIKAVLMRYGGLSHRTALPFFLGLLVGGALQAVLRRCLSLLLGVNLSFLAT